MNYETQEQRINREFWETFKPTKHLKNVKKIIHTIIDPEEEHI